MELPTRGHSASNLGGKHLPVFCLQWAVMERIAYRVTTYEGIMGECTAVKSLRTSMPRSLNMVWSLLEYSERFKIKTLSAIEVQGRSW